MKLLIDTHCWLWMQSEPERLKPDIRRIVSDPAQQLFFSAASAWEIAIKHSIGKLTLPRPPNQYVPSRMTRTGTLPLPIVHAHVLRVALLPPHHRDPFDRLLVAQAQVEKLTLLTADRQLEPYDVKLLWT